MGKAKKHKATTLRRDLATVLNAHSREQNSDTPDFILARYLINCLAAYETATADRERWHSGEIHLSVEPREFPIISVSTGDASEMHSDRARWLRAVENSPAVTHSGVVFPNDPRWLQTAQDAPAHEAESES
jgi:hypothetical protein